MSNIALAYNIQKMYKLSLEITNQIIHHIYSKEINKQLEYIMNHYLFSNYMLGFYEVIDDFYCRITLDKAILFEQAIMLIILAERKLGNKGKIDDLLKIPKERNSEDVKYLIMMINALDSIDKGKPINLDGFYEYNYYKIIKEEIIKEQNNSVKKVSEI